MQPFRIPSSEEILRMIERLLGLEEPTEAPLPIFDAPLEVRKAIQRKVTEDLNPKLYRSVQYDFLAKRYEEVPELVENLLFAYLVKVEYLGPETLVYDGVIREERVWSTYFKRIHDPEKMIEYLLYFMQSDSGEPLNPEDVQVIEVLPNIPFPLWKAYKDGKIDMDTVRAEIEALPEV